MRRNATGLVLATTVLASGCASTAALDRLSDRGPSNSAAATAPAESFSYRAAADHNVRVSVDRVVVAGDPDFVPQDRNWLQVHVTIANVGPRTIKLDDVKERLADGQVVASAQSPSQLVKPPDFLKQGLTTVGVGTAGMLVGALLFPPAALASGAYIAFAPLVGVNRMQHSLQRARELGLRADSLAPGSNTRGCVWLPAVTGQTGLIVFYEVDGRTASLPVERMRF